jgi:hypothetical protein
MKSPQFARDLCFAAVIAGGLMIVGCRPSVDSTIPTGTRLKPETDSPALPASSASGSQPDSADGSPRSLARFTQRTPGCGVECTYRNGEEAGHFAIVESLGGGAALFDFDGDGSLDLFLLGGGSYGPGPTILGRPPALYRQSGPWQFENVTKTAGVDAARHYSHGAAAGDSDNDGFTDVVVTGYGGLMFFRNQGDGTFSEDASAALLADTLWSSSAAWGDFDFDGDLDLYVAHYVDWSFKKHPFCKGPRPDLRDVCPPRRFEPLPHVLYENQGDGTFQDVSEMAGLRSDGKGLGVVVADVNLDGAIDIYVANDTVPNFLYRNLGNGRFADAGLKSGTSLNDMGSPDGSMGVDVGDFNGDGLPDLWVANFERESFALYRNEGNCDFQHVSQSTGVTALGGLYVGWGTVFLDFDRDGDEDVFVSNGHVVRYPTNAPLKQRPLLLENDRGQRFVNVAGTAGEYFTSDHMGRGVALGDIDGDGDLDLAVVATNDPVALLSNESPNRNHWISLRLIGRQSSRDPIGAVVRFHTAAGISLRQVKGGGSYASTSDLRIFTGLGDVAEIQRVEIHWPSGCKQNLMGLPVDRRLTIIEPANDWSAGTESP